VRVVFNDVSLYVFFPDDDEKLIKMFQGNTEKERERHRERNEGGKKEGRKEGRK
jgi:hypothetical protein